MIKKLSKNQLLTICYRGGGLKRLKSKGFTLIELLAVIVILAVVALVATPIIMTTVSNARKSAASSSTLGYIKAINNSIGLAEIEGNNPLPDGTYNLSELTSKIDIKVQGKVPTDGMIKITDGIVNTANFNIDGFYVAYDNSGTKVVGKITGTNTSVYKEELLAGSYPIYSTYLIPVVIANDGSVTKADITTEWYKYADKKWANAIILKDDVSNKYDDSDYGTEIDLEDIESYFVWIPKYSYKLFYDFDIEQTHISGEPESKGSNKQTIDIRFGITNTSDSNTGECTTPMVSGEIGECAKDKYMTHPAFISMNTNGFWVAKFETTGNTSNLSVLPGETSLRDLNVKSMFELAYNYKRNNDSHMMKNTEWGAVAYLSHSAYGIGTEVRINNNSDYKTGYAATNGVKEDCYGSSDCAVTGTTEETGKTQPYNTTDGYTASTTGNITGVYDMAGGAHEYMAAYGSDTYGGSEFDASTISKYNSKYFDVYKSDSTFTSTENMILGDATGEMGLFYNYADKDINATTGNYKTRYHNNWYADSSNFVDSSNPWFHRGGHYSDGVIAGQFNFSRNMGGSNDYVGFRLVLNN